MQEKLLQAYKDLVAAEEEKKKEREAALAFAREAYREVKEECMKSEIARSAAEEAGKKAHEDLEDE